MNHYDFDLCRFGDEEAEPVQEPAPEETEVASLRAQLRESETRHAADLAALQTEKWKRELKDAERAYPDVNFRKLSFDPAFRALLTFKEHPFTVTEAYEALHLDEIKKQAAVSAEQKLIQAIRSRAARPTENGAGAQGGARLSPHRLTKKDREALAQRAAKGEYITF